MKISVFIIGVLLAVGVLVVTFFTQRKSVNESPVLFPEFFKIDEGEKISKVVAENIFSSIQESFLRDDGLIEGESGKALSESQSYGMLMATWLDNREMFDRVWVWTKKNLQTRTKDNLFSWRWENGRVTDVNPATDADQDIAYALYLAYKRWGDEKYLTEAKGIVADIWTVETEIVAGIRYVAAGNWAVTERDGVIVNPSYLAPYQYRVFAEIDPEHDWMGLVDSSYKILNLCTGVVGLAQDWCKIDNQGNVVKNFRLSKTDSSVYSYDALRVPYRVSMDYVLNNDQRAIEYLKRNKVFIDDWKKNEKIFSVYNQRGEYVEESESLAGYGAQLASMSLLDKEIAQEIFEKKIYSIESFKDISFYDLSWLWFGLHFYGDTMANSRD